MSLQHVAPNRDAVGLTLPSILTTSYILQDNDTNEVSTLFLILFATLMIRGLRLRRACRRVDMRASLGSVTVATVAKDIGQSGERGCGRLV